MMGDVVDLISSLALVSAYSPPTTQFIPARHRGIFPPRYSRISPPCHPTLHQTFH